MKQTRSRWIISGGLTVLVAVALLQFQRFARTMTLRRLALFPRYLAERTPAELGLPFEEVWFESRDGLKLHGWYIPASASLTPKNVTILMGHGHTTSKEPDLEYARFFHQAGYNVFTFDFRGHGRSQGPKGSSVGYWERLDVHGAVDWLLSRGQDRLAAFGISMGASILIMATAENPFIRALISDSAFAHLYRSIAAEITNMWHLPMWLARPLGYYSWRILAAHHRFPRRAASPADYVAAISPRPLLIIHGDQDRLTRVENAYLLSKLSAPPTQLWIQPGLGHVQGYQTYGQAYERRLLDFLETVDWQQPPDLRAPSVTLDGIPVN